MSIDFSAVQVVHFESSVKHEPSLILRVTLNKSWPRNTLVVRTLHTVSMYMHPLSGNFGLMNILMTNKTLGKAILT